jgi:hypothetical protein
VDTGWQLQCPPSLLPHWLSGAVAVESLSAHAAPMTPAPPPTTLAPSSSPWISATPRPLPPRPRLHLAAEAQRGAPRRLPSAAPGAFRPLCTAWNSPPSSSSRSRDAVASPPFPVPGSNSSRCRARVAEPCAPAGVRPVAADARRGAAVAGLQRQQARGGLSWPWP